LKETYLTIISYLQVIGRLSWGWDSGGYCYTRRWHTIQTWVKLC